MPPLSNWGLKWHIRIWAIQNKFIIISVTIQLRSDIGLLSSAIPSLSLSLFCKIGACTYLQNCTYHKVLLSAANKSVLRIVSKEIESPLNVLSNGCLGLQYCWVLAAYGSSEVKKRALLASFGWLFGGFFHADHFNHKNHSHEPDVENLRRIEFIHENWHSTSLYHPLTGQREAGRFPNIP